MNDSGRVMRCMSGRYGGKELCGSEVKQQTPIPNPREPILTQGKTTPNNGSWGKTHCVLGKEGDTSAAALGVWGLAGGRLLGRLRGVRLREGVGSSA